MKIIYYPYYMIETGEVRKQEAWLTEQSVFYNEFLDWMYLDPPQEVWDWYFEFFATRN